MERGAGLNFRSLLRQREAAREDVKAEREMKGREMWAKAVGTAALAPATPSATAPGGTVDTSMPAQGGAMPSATPAEAGAAPPPAQPRRDGLQINWDALNQYAQLGPEEAKRAHDFAKFAVQASKEQIDLGVADRPDRR